MSEFSFASVASSLLGVFASNAANKTSKLDDDDTDSGLRMIKALKDEKGECLRSCASDDNVACKGQELVDTNGDTVPDTYVYDNADGKVPGLKYDGWRGAILLGSPEQISLKGNDDAIEKLAEKNGVPVEVYEELPAFSTYWTPGLDEYTFVNKIYPGEFDKTGAKPYNSDPEYVTLDRMFYIDASTSNPFQDRFWIWTDAYMNIDSARKDFGASVPIDECDDPDVFNMAYGALHGLNMENWTDRMAYYFGAGFYVMQDTFRNEALMSYENLPEGVLGYRHEVAKGLVDISENDLFDEKRENRLMDGVLALTYAFTPTGVGFESSDDEGDWVSFNISKMGELAQDEEFAEVLMAGYFLHRADDNYAKLIAGEKSMSAEDKRNLIQSIEADLVSALSKVGIEDPLGREENAERPIIAFGGTEERAFRIAGRGMKKYENLKSKKDPSADAILRAVGEKSPIYAMILDKAPPTINFSALTNYRDQLEFAAVIWDRSLTIFEAIKDKDVEAPKQPDPEPATTPVKKCEKTCGPNETLKRPNSPKCYCASNVKKEKEKEEPVKKKTLPDFTS